MGHAMRLVAEDVLQKIRELASKLGMETERKLGAAKILVRRYGMQAGNIIGTGSFMFEYISPDQETGRSTNITPNWMIGATGIEVEVDTETGQFRILRFENASELGTPINPEIVKTQISGAAIMQLGAAIYEKMHFDEQGQLRNASFAEYKLPGFQNLPPKIHIEIVDAYQSNGPFGAKGVGESGCYGVASAIAAAIEDAAGVRLKSLPMKYESVCRALHESVPHVNSE